MSTNTHPSATDITRASAPSTGPIAAIALPPQIAVPVEMSWPVTRSTASQRASNAPNATVAASVNAVVATPVDPARTTASNWIPKPKPTTDACSSHFCTFAARFASALPTMSAKANPPANAHGGVIAGHAQIAAPTHSATFFQGCGDSGITHVCPRLPPDTSRETRPAGPVKTDLFDYPLPERLIAQAPLAQRDASRLLVVHRAERRLEHRTFRDLGEYLHPDDTLFRNNAAVIPARLHARRPTGGAVECLLLRPATDHTEWWCLLRPGRKLPPGETFGLPYLFTATVREKTDEGTYRVRFECADGDILAVANRIGEMPLPPYITGRSDDAAKQLDRERYQTVYADRTHQVAAAAPTAGLHFTPELLARLAAQGVRFSDVTLHVGLGTFRPIATEHVEEHAIHRELYEVPLAAQRALFAPSGRRIAVGTTSLRTLEDFRRRHAAPLDRDYFGEADLYVYPPANFNGVDALITNFHQPRSTLLCLISAFLAPGSADGITWFKEIYAEAVAQEYRFLSYGDAMLIL